MVELDAIRAVADFRDDFVAFTDDVIASYRRSGFQSYVDRSAIPDLHARQDHLNERYGELYDVVNAKGPTIMTVPALGVVSHDVIQDAINDFDDSNYTTMVTGARQHLSRSIGMLRGSTIQPARRRQSARELDSEGLVQRNELGPRAGVTWVKGLATAAAALAVTVVILFFTAFGADWNTVRENWVQFVEWLPI